MQTNKETTMFYPDGSSKIVKVRPALRCANCGERVAPCVCECAGGIADRGDSRDYLEVR
jgi:hypothetical protein